MSSGLRAIANPALLVEVSSTGVFLPQGDSMVQVRGAGETPTFSCHPIGSLVPDVREKFELLIPSYSS